MKYSKLYLCFIIVITFTGKVFSKELPTPHDLTKYKKAGLVWGLLKYKHSDVSLGKYNWDNEFLKLLSDLKDLNQETAVDSLLFRFVSKFDSNKIALGVETEDTHTDDYEWISTYFANTELKKVLVKISQNKKVGDYYAKVDNQNYISFPHEDSLEKFDATNYAHRLLLFYKFWNTVHYWNVNADLTKNNWFSILDTYTKAFLEAADYYNFELVKSTMISELHDSHTYYLSNIVNDRLFKFKPNFSVAYVNDSLVVSYIFNKNKCDLDNISLGDVITKINGVPIQEDLLTRLSTLFSASNFNFLTRFSYYLLCRATDTVEVTLLRNDVEVSQTIHLSEKLVPENSAGLARNYVGIKKLNNDDYYLDLSTLTKKQCDSFFKANKQKGVRNLILDLRKNSNPELLVDHLCDYLIPEKKEFIKVIGAVAKSPLTTEVVEGSGLVSLLASPFVVGKTSKVTNVTGKIILLVNANTQSRGEYFGMAIQQAANCITIGSQTAGSPMNITDFNLPDGTPVYFTSFKAFYPNSEVCVQQNGLKIDYEVSLRAKNYSFDQYIDFALQVLNNY